jgi:hypothetical protein
VLVKQLISITEKPKGSEMKKKATVILSLALLGLLTTVLPVMGAKPLDIISTSNGYPSGEHCNLNIHGKDPAKFDPDLTLTGGNSVFIDLYGDSTITFRSDNRSSLTELTALDPYAEAFDNDPVLVQIPYESEGYFVFARLKGKPNNGSKDDESSVILTPNTIPRTWDYDTSESGDLLLLGLVTTNGTYEMTSAGLTRFDSKGGRKKKDKAVDVTGLFLWTGWSVDASLDTSGPEATPDGLIDEYDVPESYDLLDNGGDGDGVIGAAELAAWLADMAELGLAVFHDNEWIFDIADVVEQDQTISNDGATLLKLRLYPVDSTSFSR